MRVARDPSELEARPRAVALGTFDGVHLGHRGVLEAAVAAGETSTAVTFEPHPRVALGYEVELLTSPERRLELLAETGIDETLVLDFDLELARLDPEEFVARVLTPIGTDVVVAGSNFRFGRGRSGDLDLLRGLGLDVRAVPLVEGASSTRIRDLLRSGEVERAAGLLGRAPEVEGTVVAGDARGGTLGFPTANLRPEPGLLVPGYGIYAGAADGYRAAISIGTNPHYGGEERRIEAFLLDFGGDLYGRRLRLQLWERLRDERAFESEAELVAQIGRDVEAARRAVPPA
ncbi:MAG TPA: bifunctional riboflavin kinase/FMN adenylyltransferase [Gaiellaceae bacterium]|nr:bifunctional riboflavin kinase/FMN adenylyltransferase [Gaiellaceae bacterium]